MDFKYLQMSLRRSFILLSFIFTFCITTLAQVAQSNNYTFSTGTSGNLSLDMNSNAIDLSAQPDLTIIGTATNLATMDIGFDFWFMGTRYFQLTPQVRGAVGLGPIVPTSLALPNLNQVVASSAPLLAPFWNNNTFSPGIGRNLRTKVVGTAPNRCYVFEWRLISNSSYYGAGDMVFQMRLYETSGIVEYVYGNMSISTGSVSAVINQAAIGFTLNSNLNNRLASVTNLSTYTNTFLAGLVNNAVVSQQAPGPISGLSAGRFFRYTPAIPAAPTSLTFSGVSPNSMTLNWTDNSSNEVGFAVYRSDDGGTTFNYITLVPQNITTFTQSLLSPGISYQYRVVAVSEGGNSANLSGTQATTAGTTITSTVSGGLWSSATTWVGGIVPNINNNVSIANGATVTIDGLNATCNNLTVGAGTSGILRYSANASAALFVNGNATVSVGAIFDAGTSSIQTHNLTIGGFANTGSNGSLTVNGTLNLSNATSPNSGAGVITTFGGQGNGTISGTGVTCNFFAILVNKGIFPNPLLNNQIDVTRIITINTPTTSASRLTINAGTFRISSASVLTPYNGSQTICNTGGRLWLNNASCSIGQMNAGTFIGAGSPTINGELRIDNGTFTYGSGNNTMTFNTTAAVFNGVNTTFGSRLEMNGGTLNMYGAITFGSFSSVFFNMTGGNINVDMQSANILSSTSSAFTINGTTSVNWSGGTVTIVDPPAAITTTNTVNILAGGHKNIRGGTLQIGDGISASGSGPINNSTGFLLSITAPIWNLVINTRTDLNATRICRLFTGVNLMYNNVTINANSYLMLSSAGGIATMALYGDLTNNGVLSGVEPNSTGVSGVLQFLDSTGTQTVSGTGTFSNIQQITLAPSLSFNQSSNNVIFNQTNNIVINAIVLATGTLTHNGKLIIGRPGVVPIVQLGGFGQTVTPGTFATVPTFDNTSFATQYNYITSSTPYVLGASNEIGASTSTIYSLLVSSHKGLTIGRNLTIVNALTMTLGNISIGNNNLTLGTGISNIGTLGYTTGNIICGATGTFTRWYNTTAAPTSQSVSSQFPVGGLSDIRHAWVYLTSATSLSSAGTISVRHANLQGLSTMSAYTENAVLMDTRTNANWVFSIGNGLTLGTGTIGIAMRTDGALLNLTTATNNTITDAGGVALNGTFSAGTGAVINNMVLQPQANRIGISSFAALTANPLYIGSPAANAQSAITAIANGNWNTATNWSSGTVPVITDNVIIPLGITISTSVGAACVANVLAVQPGGILNVDGNTLTINRSLYLSGLANNRETYGIINLTAGSLNVIGDALTGGYIATASTITNIIGGTLNLGNGTDCSKQINIPTGALFNIYGGTVNVYGSVSFAGIINQTGGNLNIYPLGPIGGPYTAAASAAVHSFLSSNIASQYTAGTITIVDPPYAGATTMHSIQIGTSTNWIFTGTHTFVMGDGTSTATNGNPFRCETFYSSATPINNLTINGGSTLNRHTETGFNNSTSYGLHLKGTLTINSGSEFRHTNLNQLQVGGALVNNGTFTQSSTTPLTLGFTSITLPLGDITVSGTGVFQNATSSATASFANLTIATGNVVLRSIMNVNNLSVSGALTLTSGQLDLGTNNFTLGNVTGSLGGILSYTSGSQILTGTGGSFTRVFPIAALPTSVATGNAGHYPFGKFNTLNNTFERRDAFVFSTNAGTLSTGGTIKITPSNVNGNTSVTSFNDGTLLNVTNRTNSSWNISNTGIVLGSGNISLRTIGENAGISTLAANTANTTLMLSTGAANGTYAAGANFLANLTAPDFNRNGLAVADISNVSYYGGIQGASNTGGNFVAIANGDWNNIATWNTGTIPTATDNVQIPPPFSVIVNSAAANFCNNLTINSGGTLIANNNTLTIAGQIINFGNILVGGSTLSINNSNVLGMGLVNQSGSLFTLNAGTVNMGPVGGGMATLNNIGTLTINAGTFNLNGNFIHTGTAFNMVSGNFNIDGNNNTSTGSVVSGTNIVSLSGTQTITGGMITIIDPPFIGSALAFSNTASTNVWSNNVLRFGDGISTNGNSAFIAVSTPLSNQTCGFLISSASTNLGNILVNGGSSTRIVTINGTTLLATSLTINSGSEFRSTANTGTASTLNLTGDLTNNGILTSAINNTLTLSGVVQQTVTGLGVFRVDTLGTVLSNINNLTISNSNVTGVLLNIGNVIIGGNATVSGALSLTGAGPLNIGSNTLTLGTSDLLPGSLASATGVIVHNTGGTFKRWYSATAAPTSAVIGARFPLGILVNGTILRRDFYAFSSTATLTTGGTLAVSHIPTAGTTAITSFTDGTVLGIDTRSNSYWNVVNTGITTGGTFGVNAVANGMIFPLTLASTSLTTNTGLLGGTIGTTTGTQASPNLVRTAMSLTDLTATPGIYVAAASSNYTGNIFTVAGGNWSDPTIWSTGTVPTSNDNVTINANHYVTLNANGSTRDLTINGFGGILVNANTLTVNNLLSGAASSLLNINGGTVNVLATTAGTANGFTSSGNLNLQSGTLSISQTGVNNRTFTSAGTTNIAGGNLIVNGNINYSAGTWQQSGGIITVDGNNETAAGSVASATNIVQFTGTTHNVTGGSMIIVDPHFGPTGLAFNYNSSTSNNWTNHTLQFGDGVSTTMSGAVATVGSTVANLGFSVSTTTATTTGRITLHDVIVNGNGANRHVSVATTTSNSLDIGNNLTINTGSDLRTIAGLTALTGGINVGGNITNNGKLIIGSNTTLGFRLNASTQSLNNQVLSGTGTYLNDTLATCSPCFSNININSFSNQGVVMSGLTSPITIDQPLGTISSSLTFGGTASYLNLGNKSLVIGGSAAKPGTLSGTFTGNNNLVLTTGSITRWFNAGVAISGSVGVFPIGIPNTPINLNRVITLTSTANPTTGGTITVSHSNSSGTTAITSFLDGTVTIDRRLNTNWNISASSITAGGGSFLNMQVQGSGLSTTNITSIPDLRITGLLGAASGTQGTNSGSILDPVLVRNGFSEFTIASAFYVGGNPTNPLDFTSISGNTLTGNQTVCSGNAAILTGSNPTGGTGNYAYTWLASTTSATSGFTVATGVNTGLNYTSPALTQNTWYRRLVVSGSNRDTSIALAISITQLIANNTISGTATTICSGNIPAVLTGSIATGGNGSSYTYLWQSSTTSATTGFASASGVNNTTGYIPSSITTSTWYRRVVSSGACSADSSAAIAIGVYTPLTGNTIAGPQTICLGTVPAILTGTTPSGGVPSGLMKINEDFNGGIVPSGWALTNTAGILLPSTTINSFARVGTAGAWEADFYDISAGTAQFSSKIFGATTAADSLRFDIASKSYPGTYYDSVFILANTGSGFAPLASWVIAQVANTSTGGITTLPANTAGYTSPAGSDWFTKAVALPVGTTQVRFDFKSNYGNNVFIDRVRVDSNVAYNYVWQSSTTSASAGYGAATGTNNAINYTPVALTQSTWFRRIATGVCTPDTSSALPITVVAALSSNTVSGAQNVCTSSIPTILTGSTPIGGVPLGLTKINEDFNGGLVPSGWALTNTAGILLPSTTINSFARVGTAGAWEANFYDISAGTAQFSSKIFGATNAADSLRFDIASKSYPGSYFDSVFILANTGSGFTPLASWVIAQVANTSTGGITTLPASTGGYVSPAASDWFTKAIALPVGTTQVRFDFKSNYGNNIFIDRVRVDSVIPYNYTWQKSTTSAIAGFTAATGINNTISYSPTSTITQNTWYRRVINAACIDTSNAVQLTPTNTNSWTGTTSTAWGTATNWGCGRVPIVTDSVIIVPTSNQPIVIDGNRFINHLAINSGATLTINNTNSQLGIAGTFTKVGTLTHTNGYIGFLGTALQTVPANTYARLYIGNPAGIQLSGNIVLTDTLNFDLGPLFLGSNTLTMSGSNSIFYRDSATRHIITNGTGTVNVANMGTTGRTSAVRFPVGISATSFTPITLTNSGTLDQFNVRVISGVNSNGLTGTAITSNAVNRTWAVNEVVTGGSNAIVTLQWNAADELSGFTRANSYLAYYNGTTWVSNTTSAASGSNPYTQTRSGITTFSALGVGSGGTLPVQLISFKGKRLSEKVQLNWITASEINNDYFIIERSSNNNQFEMIGSKINGNGNSSVENRYQEFDNNAIDFATKNGVKTIYYRLRQVDFDGSIIYSNVISVSIDTDLKPFEAIAYPNPFNNNLSLNITSLVTANTLVQIVDINGRLVHSENLNTLVGNSTFTLNNLDLLADGMYFIKVIQGAENKIIKLTKMNK